MKKFVLLSMLGLLLASCTKDGLKKPDDNSGESVATSYLSVSLVAANRAGTRVTAGEPDDSDFQDGTEAENEVKRVRFFFFDGAGNPAQVYKRQSSSASESYIDVYPSAMETPEVESDKAVEKIIQVTLGINPASNDNLPKSVVAVINPDEQVLALGQTPSGTLYGPSLDELRDAVYDFKTGLTDKNFVMSNSVYVENNKIIDAVTLEDNNFADTLEKAQEEENQVIIYVERVLARLDLTIALEDEPITTEAGFVWPVRDEKGNLFTVDGDETDIYVSFLGWNITATPSASRLVKQVGADWTDLSIFGSNTPSGGPWNTADYHRSFWATNPKAGRFDYQYGIFGTLKPEEEVQGNFYQADANKIPKNGECAPVYLQENAGPATEGGASTINPTVIPTKVILAARLVNNDGKPLELAEWAYKKYTLSALKTMFASDVLQLLYKKTGNGEYKKIEPEDLTFKTATQLGTNESNYYVYPVLTPQAENLEWYLLEDAEKFSDVLEVKNVNAYMRDKINHVMVWNGGYTYYYFDIRHLGDEGSAAFYGIVRNHLYQAKVTRVAGLGTPVYEPGEIIIPEKPEGDESIISAEVKILQWRIVSQNYELIW